MFIDYCCHLSGKGAELVAKKLTEFIKKNWVFWKPRWDEKTFRDLDSGFVLTYGERGHRKLFPFTTDTRQSVQCTCSVCSMFFYFLEAKF